MPAGRIEVLRISPVKCIETFAGAQRFSHHNHAVGAGVIAIWRREADEGRADV